MGIKVASRYIVEMWLVHNVTGEEGWHICQENQRGPCNFAVFVKDGGAWRLKMWPPQQVHIRAKTHAEHLQDYSKIQFPLKH